MISNYAKSKPIEPISQHTKEVIKELEIIKDLYGKQILKRKEIDKEQFWQTAFLVCQYHDCGKYFIPFQNEIRKQLKEKLIETLFDYTIKHEQLSPLFIPEEELEKLDKTYQKIAIQAIYYHHEREGIDVNPELVEEIIKQDFLPRMQDIEKDLQIPIEKNPTISYLRKTNAKKRIRENEDCYIEYCLIKGILHQCDHAGSAHLPVEKESKKILAEETIRFLNDKNYCKNKLQEFCLQNQENNAIVIGSTGLGKTEGGALWANHDKLLYTLPFRISINDIFLRLSKLMEEGDVGLLHSSALDYLEDLQYSPELYDLSKSMSSKILTCTINQIFPFALKPKGFEKMYSMLSYSKIIIDEIQAYAPKTTAIILKGLEMIQKIGGKFMIMTATLPQIYKEYLTKRGVEFAIGEFPNTELKRHKIELKEKAILEDIEEIFQKSKNSKVLVIANTVNRAIEIYKKLKENDNCSIKLLHARFIEQDKQKLEEEIKEFARSDSKGIWVTTQIVEASLDIDFDYLFTEISTLDSLFQRMGRCYRKRNYEGEEANIKIYSKEASGIKYVYDEKITQMGIELLKKQNSVLEEQVKMDLVKILYSEEMLKGTNYWNEFQNAIKKLDNLIEYEITETEAKEILNEIDTIPVIPKELMEENITLLEQYEKEMNYQIKHEIKRKIQKLLVNVRRTQAKGRAFPVRLWIKRNLFYRSKI